MMNPLKSWSLAICWTGLISTSLFAGSGSKLSEDLLVGDPDQPVDVIVKFKDVASDSNINKVASHGPKHKVSLNLLRSAAFNARRRDLVDVANDPAVEAITPDYEIRGSAFSGSPDYGWMSALQLSSATGTLPYDGTGISVALIDSGMRT
jgi:hypothetical protein